MEMEKPPSYTVKWEKQSMKYYVYHMLLLRKKGGEKNLPKYVFYTLENKKHNWIYLLVMGMGSGWMGEK